MEATNNFSGAQNSDISKIFQSNNEYLKATNLRPITTVGGSNGGMVNIKGNAEQIEFPSLKGVYRLRIVLNPGTSSTESITINGQTTATFTVDDNTSTADIYAQIILLPNCSRNLGAVNPTFDVAYQGDDLVIYQLVTFTTGGTTNATEPLIIVTQVSGAAGDTRLYFVDNTNTTTLSYTPNVPGNNGDQLIIIGSTFINETFYLFTCPYTNSSDIGQIWQLDYNELTKISTLVLLYNGLLNFHKEFPIPPSAAIGRFELTQIQRIYWSDNNNPVRSVNTKDTNLMAFSIDLINLRPSIQMSIPVLQTIIDGGAVATLGNSDATFQCAYRLLKNNGAMTNFSEVSNLVTLIPQRTDIFTKFLPNFTSMVGTPSTVNKAIRWEVDGIDPDYDIIEFYVIIRTAPNINTFKVFKFDTQLVNGNTKLSTTYINDQANEVEITLDEFLLESTIFTHCKTLEQKDNRLFFGNVKNDINTALEDFDTRAYRFRPSSTTIDVKKFESDLTATQYTITNPLTDYSTIQENADNIPLKNLGMSSLEDPLVTNTTKNYKYKRNSTIVGGEGPNVSYSFGNLLLRMDTTPNYPLNHYTLNEGTARDVVGTQLYPNGYRKPTGDYFAYTGLVPNFDNGAPNQTYRMNDTILTMGIEYLNGMFRTGQHNEIYRYGIMFRSKTGEQSFVKWIGDIKMPDYSDLADPALLGKTDLGAVCPDFRSVYYDGVSAYSVLPYVQFEVIVSAELAATIGGYEIVRCERQEQDKTIHSHGLITQVAVGPPSDPTNYYLPFSHYISGQNIANNDPPSTNSFIGRATPDIVAYHSMDSLCSYSASMFEEDDQLLISEAYSKVWDVTINPSGTPIANANELYAIKKYYSKSQNFYNQTAVPNTHVIKEAYYVDQDSISPTISTGGGVYKNQDWQVGGTPGSHFSVGNPVVVIGIKNSSFVWNTYNFAGVNSTPGSGTQGTAKLLGLHFKPSNLATQYGGRGYLQRSTREYISTGAYYPVDVAGTTTIKVFGGDIFHSILDIQKSIKNWLGTQAVAPYASEKHSQTWYFPHQSTINIDLRDGTHVNADLNTDNGILPSASGGETYLYEPTYSYPNNIKKYVAKPPFFNETNTWINRVYWSDVKINGENSDSWTSIPTLNYYDVEGGYGPINALVILNNNMYFVQNRAFGVLMINPVSVVNDNNGAPLRLASGTGVLEKHNYYTIDVGSKHQWSVFRSSDAITFIDVRSKKIYLFDGKSITPISDTENNRGNVNILIHDNLLVDDNPIIGKGMLTTYDSNNNEFLYTFLNTDNLYDLPDEKNTLVYSDLKNKFTGFYSFTPYIYINNNNRIFSPKDYSSNTDSTLWLHDEGNYCEFYGTIYKSTVKVNVNDNPKYTKTFDNLSWITDAIEETLTGGDTEIPFLTNTFDRVRCYNEYQNSDYITLTNTNPITNLRKSEQQWNIQIPRNKVNYDVYPIDTFSIFDPTVLTKTTFGDRMRDKFLVVDLEYDNLLNKRFILHTLGTTYRISNR